MNFGLCRILIATLLETISPQATFSLLENANDVFWDVLTTSTYTQYVQSAVFAPAGVVGATLDHPTADALAYNFPVVGNGWNSGDLTTMSGGAGWHLSPDDLLAVMGTLRRGGAIMSAAAAQAMLDDGFGIDETKLTPLGTLYRKDGLWTSNEGKTEQSVLIMLPRDMELVVFANSPIGTAAKWFSGVVSSAYSSAIQSGRSLRGYFLRKGLAVTTPVHTVVGSTRSVRQVLRD